ncbi:hypothetical protein BV98_000271 [Sphingobium herbicidovorans NBRC 16415]|uniref:Uncharacterized protein n=1 Tax=Sphingobium herbicidovorans (strain ATCC 700291 / DSM 11019 / CCUG 56400 / KCTC 2939 / LMG 18315 / NBRC 16415 / MH) TaxID=1219045 RepID=A0A086PF52_SPHHM|nr:hypothetical protein [Sphingobium herbicidovorans]KFG92020.1 hypothetical protein BV98_000271 [Sphingobium herbicidovorans NBRC 16415]
MAVHLVIVGGHGGGGRWDPIAPLVQQRRWLPARMTQGMQNLAHDRIIGALFGPGVRLTGQPWLVKLLDRYAMLAGYPRGCWGWVPAGAYPVAGCWFKALGCYSRSLRV